MDKIILMNARLSYCREGLVGKDKAWERMRTAKKLETFYADYELIEA